MRTLFKAPGIARIFQREVSRRRLGSIGAIFFILLTIAGTASPTHASKKVSFINPGFQDQGFWKAVSDTMRVAAKDFDFELEILSANREWPRMLANAKGVINRSDPPDYLILVNEHQQAPELLALAEERGIKTILLLNTLTKDQRSELGGERARLKHWIGSITPDNRIAGFEIAQSIFQGASDRGLSDDGKISTLVLAGDFKTPASLQRLEGLDNALKGFADVSIERRLTVNWSFKQAYRRTTVWLKSKPLDAVWAANDPIALGALKALREAGQTPGKDVFVAGLNWSTEALKLVQSGALQLTHGGHFLAGAWVMVLLHDFDRGHDFAQKSPHIHFPMTAIDRSNVDHYLDRLGDSDWSKIDFKRFSRAENRNLTGYDFSISALLRTLEK